MVTITRGDVALCDLNPVMGTEQAEIRPVVILQTTSVGKHHRQAVKILEGNEKENTH